MSYDILVFLPEAAPPHREDFLAWFGRVVRLQDGHLSNNPEGAPAPLRRWWDSVSRTFPLVTTSGLQSLDAHENWHGADYRFSDEAIFARFQWELWRKALRTSQRAAQDCGIGLFDVSGHDAAVWMPVADRFKVVHRGDRIELSKLPG